MFFIFKVFFLCFSFGVRPFSRGGVGEVVVMVMVVAKEAHEDSAVIFCCVCARARVYVCVCVYD